MPRVTVLGEAALKSELMRCSTNSRIKIQNSMNYHIHIGLKRPKSEHGVNILTITADSHAVFDAHTPHTPRTLSTSYWDGHPPNTRPPEASPAAVGMTEALSFS